MTGETKQVERSGVVAYVDGSYHSGTGEFSYGVVILRDGKELCFQEKLNDPSLAAMHNVAGEIKGAECAMRYAVAEGCQRSRSCTTMRDRKMVSGRMESWQRRDTGL